MAGTKDGGKQASKTNKLMYGDDFYSKIGAKGGRMSGTGGFWYLKHVKGDTKKISEAGKIGGKLSRRGDSAKAQKARIEARKAFRAEQVQLNYEKLQKIANRGAQRPW